VELPVRGWFEGNESTKIFVWEKRSSIRRYCQHAFISHRPKKEKADITQPQQADSRTARNGPSTQQQQHSPLSSCPAHSIRRWASARSSPRSVSGETLLLLAALKILQIGPRPALSTTAARVSPSAQDITEQHRPSNRRL
jgi:hypothetical protein